MRKLLENVEEWWCLFYLDVKKKIAVLNSFASTVLQKYFVQKQGGSLSDFTTSLLLFFCFSSFNLELAQIN